MHHPHIAHGIEHFFYDINGVKKLIIVMQYYQNGDVRGYTNDNFHSVADIAPTVRRKWILQLVSAVVFLHRQNIIHRDLKLENFFLDDQLDLYLGDFGIAKDIQKSRAHTFIGTSETMAPEVVSGSPYNAKADIWSLGCIIYELLCGRKPFVDQAVFVIYQKITQGDFRKLESDRADEHLGQIYYTLVDRMLVVKPADRIGDDDLIGQLEGEMKHLRAEQQHECRTPLSATAKQLCERCGIARPADQQAVADVIGQFKRVLEGSPIYEVFSVKPENVVELDFCKKSARALGQEDRVLQSYLDGAGLQLSAEQVRVAAVRELYGI